MSGIYKSEQGQRLVEERYRELLGRWPLPSEQALIDTSQGKTFVLVCGPASAPPVVLLQGSGANAAMWLREIATLAAKHRVYCVDVIGEPGLSSPVRPRFDATVYAGWLREVFDGLKLRQASLVGVSLGGWMALVFATAEPQRVDRLIVISTSGVGRAKISFVFKTLALMRMGKWGRLKAMMLAVGPMRGIPDAASIEVGRFAALIGAHVRHRRERIPLLSNEQLRRLTMPVLAIVGAQDALLDSAGTKRRLEACAPYQRVRLLPDVGHVIRGEAPSIAAFLAGE